MLHISRGVNFVEHAKNFKVYLWKQRPLTVSMPTFHPHFSQFVVYISLYKAFYHFYILFI